MYDYLLSDVGILLFDCIVFIFYWENCKKIKKMLKRFYSRVTIGFTVKTAFYINDCYLMARFKCTVCDKITIYQMLFP